MRAHHITILAVVFFPFLATQALGGLPLSFAAWEKKAWADGKIDATERSEWDALTHKANVAAAKSVATKNYSPKIIHAVFDQPRAQIAAQSQTWTPMTLEKANRGVEPEAQKAKRQLSAIVDYNRDGFMETARLSYNGKQMAVVIDFEHPRKHQMVVYKSHLVSDVEIYGAGSRILMNWPDLGYKILLLHRNKPSVVSIGD